MKCPADGTTLTMADRSGVEIDYCPQCRGVWLDRGELDKIMERSAQDFAAAAAPPSGPATRQPPPARGYDDDRGYGRHHGSHHPKRRKSFLEELFD